MPMLSDFAENELLDALTGVGSYVTTQAWLSLHDDDPGETGANEIAGGSYGRQAVDFDPAAGGVAANDAAVEFAGMPAVTITDAGLWDDETAGNFLAAVPLGAAARGFAAAIASSDAFTSPAHGLSDNDRVRFRAVSGVGTLPTGLSESTLYYVVSAATDTFEVSLTQGGAAVNFTTDGDVMWIRVVPRAVTAGDAVRFPAGNLTLRLD